MYINRQTRLHYQFTQKHILTCLSNQKLSHVLLKTLSVSLKHSAEGNEEKNYKLAAGPKTCKTYVHMPKRDKRREKEGERVREQQQREMARDNCVFALILWVSLVNLQLFKLGLPISFNLRGENMLLQCTVCLCVCVCVWSIYVYLCVYVYAKAAATKSVTATRQWQQNSVNFNVMCKINNKQMKKM